MAQKRQGCVSVDLAHSMFLTAGSSAESWNLPAIHSKMHDPYYVVSKCFIPVERFYCYEGRCTRVVTHWHRVTTLTTCSFRQHGHYRIMFWLAVHFVQHVTMVYRCALCGVRLQCVDIGITEHRQMPRSAFVIACSCGNQI